MPRAKHNDIANFNNAMKNSIIALMLSLIGLQAVAANPDFYLAGSCNDWKPNLPDYKFTENEGVYTLYLETLTGDFKITTGDWGQQYGCASKIEYGKTLDCVQSGNGYNITLPEDPAYNVVITFDYNPATKTINIDKVPALYLTGDFNGWTIMSKYMFEYKNGLYTLSVPDFSGDFKVVTVDNDKIFGNGQFIPEGSETLISENGDKMSFENAMSGKNVVTLTINPDSLLEEGNSGESTAISSIGSDTLVEYFDLNGVKVNNPGKGIFIKRTGQSIEKILIR